MQLRWFSVTSLLLLIYYSNSLSCRRYVGKTYQMQVNYGGIIGYEFVTLQSNHVAHADDSTENGVAPTGTASGPPYTSQQGKWRCIGRDRVRILTVSLNFRRANTSDPLSFTISNRTWTFTRHGNQVKGTYVFSNYPDGTFPFDSSAQSFPNNTYGPYLTSGRRFAFFWRK